MIPIDNSYFEITTKNFTSYKKYDIAICLPYYLTGAKYKHGGTEIEILPNKESEIKAFTKVITAFKTFAEYADLEVVFFILDDASPLKMGLGAVMVELGDFALVHCELTRNQGLGCKENILQYFAKNFANYCLKVDADISIKCTSDRQHFLYELIRLYKKFDCFTLSIKAGMPSYWATKEALDNGLEVEVNSGMLGNLIFQSVKNFDWFGYTDWTIRCYEDTDIWFRAKYINQILELGMTSEFPDLEHIVKPLNIACTTFRWANAMASGFGTDSKFRRAVGLWYYSQVPYLTMPVNSKKQTPTIKYDKKKAMEAIAQGFYRKPAISPHAFAVIESIKEMFPEPKKRVKLDA